MRPLRSALAAEWIKARRSRVPLVAALGFSLAPLMGGLFMIIMRDPERARSTGLISAKAQIVAGAADWPTFLSVLAQATAVGGAFVFAVVTAWIFGREFSEHTAKELLATPTSREAIVAAKLIVAAALCAALAAMVFVVGLGVGAAVGLPGWSGALAARAAVDHAITAALALALMPLVALLASAGRGYLAPLGWACLTVFLAQIVAATGWGAWFPWSVPALFSGLAGPRAEQLGSHSYLLVALTAVAGTLGTLLWWRAADHTR